MDRDLLQKEVVTCFLESDEEILILRRSRQVGSYRGKWAGVSGYVESTPDEQALVEIAEETGLGQDDIQLLKKGTPLPVEDAGLGIRWEVYPYLFHISDRRKIKIDWEHQELKWIKPDELAAYQTVPMLQETLAHVWPAA